MILPDFTVEHLRRLPLRAIVAFATRCGRRVQPLAKLPESHPHEVAFRESIEAALRIAEGFASGSSVPFEESVVEALDASLNVEGLPLGAEQAAAAASGTAHAAASSWRLIGPPDAGQGEPWELKSAEARKFRGTLGAVTADLAALNAFSAAAEAYAAVGYHNEGFVAAALNDYNDLLVLELGTYPEAGNPIDPSPTGPLGAW